MLYYINQKIYEGTRITNQICHSRCDKGNQTWKCTHVIFLFSDTHIQHMHPQNHTNITKFLLLRFSEQKDLHPLIYLHCFTSTTVPKMLVNIQTQSKIISFEGCVMQFFLHCLRYWMTSSWLCWPMTVLWPPVTPCTTQSRWNTSSVYCLGWCPVSQVSWILFAKLSGVATVLLYRGGNPTLLET
jgi:hypothetical protein